MLQRFDSSPSSLTSAQRTIHSYVLGQPGMGKSRLLESWVMQDIVAGRGLAVIDPHGDLFHNLLLRLVKYPKVWDRLVIINPLNQEWTVGINPLEANNQYEAERIALSLTDTITKIWKLDPTRTPRMLWLLNHAFLALSDLRRTLIDLPAFLLNKEFREKLLPLVRNLRAKEYFAHEFPEIAWRVQDWVSPAMNRLGGLLFDRDVRPMLFSKKTLNFRKVIDEGLIVLANFPKGLLGEGASALLGAFIVSRLQKAALSRADNLNRPPYYLYLDEFQNYTTDNIQDILSESRKYGLSLILVNQYLDQLDSDIRSAVLNTTGTLATFRIGYQDAYRLSQEMYPAPREAQEEEMKVRPGRIGILPFMNFWSNDQEPRWHELAQRLTTLAPREFMVFRRGEIKPTKLRTFDMPDPIRTPQSNENLQRMIDTSGRLFASAKPEVQQALESHLAQIAMSEGDDEGSQPTDDFWEG